MSFSEKAVPPSIEQLDPNFRDQIMAKEDDAGLCWYDAAQLEVEGQGWQSESEPYTRFPDRAQGKVREAVWDLSRHSAGLCIRFISNTTSMTVRWKVLSPSLAMPHMPSTGVSGLDIYVRDLAQGGRWHWACVARPTSRETELFILDKLPVAHREYCVYLPLYNGTLSLEIGLPKTATFRPAPSRSNVKPIVFYGTSILQGGCAARPGMAYPAIISRWLDWPHINLGFSGNALCEPEVANLVAELDGSLFVLDPLPNLQPHEVTERFGNLVRKIHAAHPRTPIIAVENIEYQNGWLQPERKKRSEGSNAALRQVLHDLETDGIYIPLVPGHNLLGDDDEATVDGTHPTDIGFLRMAQEILPFVKQALPNTG